MKCVGVRGGEGVQGEACGWVVGTIGCVRCYMLWSYLEAPHAEPDTELAPLPGGEVEVGTLCRAGQH